jgi:hypothetical protein
MTRLEAITTAFLLATGKSTLPAIGNTKRDLLTSLAVKFYRDWQTETGVEWESLSRDVSAGNASANNDTYPLADDIHFISKDENNFTVINNTKFKVVSFRQLSKYQYSNAVAHIVEDGSHSIKFSKAFATGDALIGKEILVPCIIKLEDIAKDDSDILIDQPEWLAERVAAQYAYSFKSLRDMYDDLLAMANDRMNSMKAANGTGSESYNTGVDYFATYGNVC